MLWGAFAFAVMGAFTHAAAEYYDWQVIALARSILAVMIAGLLAVREKTSMVFLRPWTLWVRSIAGSLSVMCNFYALSRLPIADALTLTNMFPVWIAVLSWPVLGRFPERDVWFGVLCGVIGLTQVGLAMIFDVIFWNRSLQIQSLLGMLLVIGPTAWLMLRGDSRKLTNG